MRSRFFGPEASTSPVTAELESAHPEFRSRRARHPRRRRDRAPVRRATRGRSRSSSTPPRSRRTTGRRASRRPTSASTPTAPSTCSRPRARTARTRRSSSARPTRSTATRPTGCRSRSSRPGSSCPSRTPTSSGIDKSMSIDRSTHSLFGASKAAADLLVQEYGRYFEHADRLLSRRLPDRPATRRRQAARLPRLPDEVRRHRHPVHGLRLRRASRCATTSTAPTWSPPSRRSATPRGRRPSTTSAAGATRNCSMLEAIAACERIAGRELDWELGPEPRIGDHRWWISDLRAVRGRLPRTGRPAMGSRTS